ncbi:MAG: UDP-N-acetylmuramate--L-alanine ligase [Candidatus Woesebacteria bacterium]|jgi:UDP-N-acetylmuramate--alanine ligase
MKKNKRVHFLGIGGSALSGVAVIAKSMGFDVTGCDLEEDTAYMQEVIDAGIKVYKGHSDKHIKDADILAATPAVVYSNKDHPEYKVGKKTGKLMMWDEFLGDYLLEGKESICITGTHGKSTTTSMAAVLFEKAEKDPLAIIGAKLKEWGRNYRVGKGKYFIIEADDFYEKFLNYNPSTIILNNIEFDHPDFFKSEDHMLEVYKKFVKLLTNKKNLIINQDSEGNGKLMEILGEDFLQSINLYGYTFGEDALFKVKNSCNLTVLERNKEVTKFSVKSGQLSMDEEYELRIPGDYNVANAAGVAILARLYQIKTNLVKETFKSFEGTVRRLELLGEKKGVKVYDDYAHHTTAIKATLEALRQRYPEDRLIMVVEAHSYSRTRMLIDEYEGVFDDADKVIVGPIFKARDTHKHGVSGYSIVRASKHKDIKFIPTLPQIIYRLRRVVKKGDVVVVMGAGKSYLWAREILKKL